MFLQIFQSVQMLQAQLIAACSLQSCPWSCPWLQAGRCRATGREAGVVGLTIPTVLARKWLLGIMFLESVLAAGLASGSVVELASEIMRTMFISVDCYCKIHKICHCFLPGNNSRGCYL